MSIELVIAVTSLITAFFTGVVSVIVSRARVTKAAVDAQIKASQNQLVAITTTIDELKEENCRLYASLASQQAESTEYRVRINRVEDANAILMRRTIELESELFNVRQTVAQEKSILLAEIVDLRSKNEHLTNELELLRLQIKESNQHEKNSV